MSNSEASENSKLRRQLKAYISQAQQNEQKLLRFQEQELQFISANGLAELLNTLLYDFRRRFGHDAITLLLIDPEFEIRRIVENLGLHDKHTDLLFSDDTSSIMHLFPAEPVPRLGRCEAESNQLLFPDYKVKPSSMALFPLIRNRQLIGCLNIGSLQQERFIHGAATDFLERLAAILAVCLENAFNHERIKLLGLLDPLTGIHNRRYFDERLDEEISLSLRQSNPLSCLFIDIDHFKQFNDVYGHHIGDLVLKQVAKLIKIQMRHSDVLARFGGEEFAVLLSQTDQHTATEIAERIRQQIEAHQITLAGNTLTVTVSIGCSTLKANKTEGIATQAGQQLLMRADEALYRSKQQGRNQVNFFDFGT
jgi:two-component system cell cycle response regulator